MTKQGPPEEDCQVNPLAAGPFGFFAPVDRPGRFSKMTVGG